MVNQVTQNHQLTNSLTNTAKELSASLQSIQPADNQTAQLITYALVGTVVAGIFVYHYIKSQESN